MSANSHAPVLPGPQSVTTVGDMARRGAVKVDEVTGWALVQCSWRPCEKRQAGRRHAQEGPCGDVGRGRPPTCQGARPPENQPRPTPGRRPRRLTGRPAPRHLAQHPRRHGTARSMPAWGWCADQEKHTFWSCCGGPGQGPWLHKVSWAPAYPRGEGKLTFQMPLLAEGTCLRSPNTHHEGTPGLSPCVGSC